MSDKSVNEKIAGLEAGYGFHSRIFVANLNLYYTSWKDRNLRLSDNDATNPGGYFDHVGISEKHLGVEFEGNARVTDKFKVNGMFSFVNWKYNGQATSNK